MKQFPGATAVIDPWHLPLVNTVLLITSSVTVTFAHHALKENNRRALEAWLAATIILAVIFLYFQAVEYHEAYTELGLTLNSGIYGATFFMLTGFHGFHVMLGTTMLFVMLLRCFDGAFSPEKHFAFEAVAWYWHFVDVVWVGLFIFVYILQPPIPWGSSKPVAIPIATRAMSPAASPTRHASAFTTRFLSDGSFTSGSKGPKIKRQRRPKTKSRLKF